MVPEPETRKLSAPSLTDSVFDALPAGATYGGEIAIAYDSESLQIKNKTIGCPAIAPPP